MQKRVLASLAALTLAFVSIADDGAARGGGRSGGWGGGGRSFNSAPRYSPPVQNRNSYTSGYQQRGPNYQQRTPNYGATSNLPRPQVSLPPTRFTVRPSTPATVMPNGRPAGSPIVGTAQRTVRPMPSTVSPSSTVASVPAFRGKVATNGAPIVAVSGKSYSIPQQGMLSTRNTLVNGAGRQAISTAWTTPERQRVSNNFFRVISNMPSSLDYPRAKLLPSWTRGTGVTMVRPNSFNFSQTSAGVSNGRAKLIRDSMRARGFVGPPIDAVKVGDSVVSLDNTRLAAAQQLNLDTIPVRIRNASDRLPTNYRGRFGGARTFGEALDYRLKNQNRPLGPSGTPERPRTDPTGTYNGETPLYQALFSPSN